MLPIIIVALPNGLSLQSTRPDRVKCLTIFLWTLVSRIIYEGIMHFLFYHFNGCSLGNINF